MKRTRERYILVRNKAIDRVHEYPATLRAMISIERSKRARQQIASWTDYQPSPLRSLAVYADRNEVASVQIKDESTRFGLGSFKALGGAYAVHDLAARLRSQSNASDSPPQFTVCCATDGNHGRAVAWGASQVGCRCRVYLHEHVSKAREEAIRSYGAEICRVYGTYDDSVRLAAHEAHINGWHLVSDASSEPDATSLAILAGYGVVMLEYFEQANNRTPTHIFVQAGVGGLAAAVSALSWEKWNTVRPTLIVVEPRGAACVLQSIRAGRVVPVTGPLNTIMAGLACGEPSGIAWRVLRHSADYAVAITDAAATHAVREFAGDLSEDGPLVIGESGVAGFAAADHVLRTPLLRKALGIGAESRVLLFGTEGATDENLWTRMTGRSLHSLRTGATI